MREGLDHYGRAADLFAEEVAKLDQVAGGVRYETRALYAAIEHGTEVLEADQTGAPTDHRVAIDLFLSIGSWLRQLADALSAYDQGIDALERGAAYLTNARYPDAAATLESAGREFCQGVSAIEAASTSFAGLDFEAIDGFADVEAADLLAEANPIRSDAEALLTYARAMTELAGSLRHISRGQAKFTVGMTALMNDEYQPAEDAFRAAVDEFDLARLAARRGEDLSPTALLEWFIQLSCLADNHLTAADHLVSAVIAAQAENWEAAAEAYNEGTAAEEAAERC